MNTQVYSNKAFAEVMVKHKRNQGHKSYLITLNNHQFEVRWW